MTTESVLIEDDGSRGISLDSHLLYYDIGSSPAIVKSSDFLQERSNLHIRMVSVTSMTQAPVHFSKSKSSHANTIPLTSLKNLIHKKQQQLRDNNADVPISDSRNASLFRKRSQQSLQDVLLRATEHCSPCHKRPKAHKAIPSALHEACRCGPDLTVAEVEAILHEDPDAARRPIRMMKVKHVYNTITHKCQAKMVAEPYRYPLNLAIYYKASPEVLERLVAAAPEVLTTPDNRSCSMHILLRAKPMDVASADMMMLKIPHTACWKDGKNNTTLHVAVLSGASTQTIRHICLLYPDLLQERNFYGQTALELAQRHSVMCSEEVADLLWSEMHQQFVENGKIENV